MATRRWGGLLGGVGAVLGLWTTATGCQSTPVPFHAQGGPVLQAAAAGERSGPQRPTVVRFAAAPGQEIALRARASWSVEARDLQPGGKMAGSSFVGPDGSIPVGPYGSLAVAGFTPEEARVRLEKHLALYLTQPHVVLTVAQAPVEAEVMWHPARHAAPSDGAVLASSMWRPSSHVAAQKADDAVATVSLRTPSAGPELKLPMGSPEAQPRAVTRVDAEPEHISSPPEPVADPLLHPVIGHRGHKNQMPQVAVGLDVPKEMNKQALPRYIIEPPDILLIESTVSLSADQPIRGQHLVRPDGTVGLGIYGEVFVAGMTLERAREAVFQQLVKRITKLKAQDVYVDVLAYNSKWYYVITDGGGYGEQVVRLPITGNETVLDAISQIYGLGPVSDKKRIWVARRNHGHAGGEQVLPVDWINVSQHGSVDTNYQLLPGDRLYVKADKWRTFDARLQKFLAPIERVLGVTLLGSETVSSVRGRNIGTGQ